MARLHISDLIVHYNARREVRISATDDIRGQVGIHMGEADAREALESFAAMVAAWDAQDAGALTTGK